MLINNEIAKSLMENKSISVFGMPFYSRMLALNSLDSYLYVCADYITASNAFEQIRSLREDAVFLPQLDDVLTNAKTGADTAIKRCAALGEIASGRARVVVTSVLGYVQLYPSLEDIKKHTLTLETKQQLSPESITQRLINAGYRRVVHIDESGQYAQRGDILDISPVGFEGGVRLDFFGDCVESIREMDFESQRSGKKLNSITVYPCIEIFFSDNDKERLVRRVGESVTKGLDAQSLSRLTTFLGDLSLKIEQRYYDNTLNVLKPLLNQAFLGDIFKGAVIFDEAKKCVDNLTSHLSEHRSRFRTLLEQGQTLGFAVNQLKDTLKASGVMAAFDTLLCQNRIFKPVRVLEYKDPPMQSFAKDPQTLAHAVRQWLKDKRSVSIYCKDPLKQNVIKLLKENSLPDSVVHDGSLYKGGIIGSEVIIGTGDLTLKRAQHTSGYRASKGLKLQPEVGQYVVHNMHGIGICEGLKRMDVNGAKRDFVVLRYEGGDRIYVSVESMNIITAYVGEENPKLNKIGGEFLKIKEKVKKAVKEMAFDLSRLYADREKARGHAYNPDNAALSEFEAQFPYEETSCQLQAVAEGLKDLIDGKVMDRLLCGDVGYGKTEVAMRLMYKVVLEGKQAAFISPTTVLASQHFNTLKKRAGGFGVNIGSLTRFDSPSEIKKTLAGLKNGSVDIVCGTHRILSKDVVFKDLGLLVLDEEQRFGVGDKEKIKLLRTDVNVLSLSATPIPRTLHMAMSGIRDISVLNTPPPSRIPVSTYVAEYSESLLFDAVSRETGRGGQVFIVYNRVEKIEQYAATVKKLFPGLRIGIAHGQMPQKQLEAAIEAFALMQTDILITSSIIENGIDMANVNTMIVVNADYFGLSQLYQLRGRIGRGNRLAYAFFTFDGTKTLTENAYKRLDAITAYTEFGSGFKLAMRDLEIRGAGNILGREQHGHMQRVGYDMYLKLIGEVMDEIKGEKSSQKEDVRVNIDFDAVIPESYISDLTWRLKAYKRISAIETAEEYKRELNELADAYGAVPQSVQSLIEVARCKNLAQKIGAIKIDLTRTNCGIVFHKDTLTAKLIAKSLDYGFYYNAAHNSLVLRPSPDAFKRITEFLSDAATPD